MKKPLNIKQAVIIGSILVLAIFAVNSTVKTQAAVPGDFGFREGDMISANGTVDPDIYVLNPFGYKRLLLSPTVMSFYGHLSFDKVKNVTGAVRDAFPTHNLYRNCETGDQRVFALEVTGEDSGLLHWVNMSGAQAVAEDPNFFKKVFCINTREFNHYAIGSTYTSLSQIPPYSRFGIGGGPTPTPTPTPTGSPTPSPTASPTPPPVSGGVSFSTASDTPASATIPKGATSVPFLKFNVSNTNSIPVTLTNVTVKRTGAGSPSDLSNVYLFQGSNRLTFGQTINSSTNEATFSGVNTVIPANSSVTLSVLADISASANTSSVHALGVISVTASSFTTTGNATGNSMTIAGVTAGTVTIADSGILTNPQIGAQDSEIAQFQLSANSTEDLRVQRIILTNAGSITNANLTDLKLKDRATNNVIATATGFDSRNRLVFEFTTPINIDRGTTKTFSLTSDIGSAARAGDTIRIYLENPADLLAIGQTFGFGAMVDNTEYDNSANNGTDASWVVIAPGQITISFNGPSSRDIAKNSQDVELFNFTITPQVNAEVRKIRFTFDGGAGTADFIGAGNVPNYRDVKVIDVNTGAVIWGPQDFSGTDGGAGDTTQTLTFTGTTNLVNGQPRSFKLTADVANNADVTSGDSIRATLDVSGFTNEIRNTDNNTVVAPSEIVPGSNIVGNTMTVRIPSLNVSLATVPTSQTVVKGSTDIALVGFNLSGGTAGDTRISSIRVTCYIDADAASDFVKGQDTDASGTVNCLETVPTIRLKVDGVQVGDSRSPGAGTDGTATFSNLNLTIPAGTTKVVQVFGDVSASAFRNANGERVSFDIDSTSTDVAASDLSGNPITVTGDDPNGATTPSRIITIADFGTITVGTAPTEIGVTDSRIVLAGTSDVTLSKVRFTAQNEDLRLSRVRILLESLATDADVSDDVISLSLYDGSTLIAGPTSLTPVGTAGTVDAYADFNTISPDFIIPSNTSKTLTVKANLNTISGGADSGDEFRTVLDFNDNFEVRGTNSSTVITSAGADVNGNMVALRNSQPRVTLATLPTGTLSNGNQVLLRFNVQAQGDDVALKHLAFEVQNSDSAGVTLSNATVREVGGTDIPATATLSGGATNTVKVTFTSEEQIAAGTTKTYELRVDVAGAGAGDTLTARMLGDSAIVTGELGLLTADQALDDLDDILNVGNDTDNDAEYNFIWSDMSAIPHNDLPNATADTDEAGSNDWTNGRHIRFVPTDTQTLNFPS